MPQHNRFRHQAYPTAPALQPQLLKLTSSVSTEPGAYAALHTRHRVREVIVVHGTFVGDDPLGISAALRSAGGGVPLIGDAMASFAKSVSDLTKHTTDDTMKDVANYSREFCEAFQRLVGQDPRVGLLEPGWSSQNHHLARADLAVRLLCYLDGLQLDPQHERVLLWGHSHAGQGFALLSNLLANDRDAVERFFEVAGDGRDEHWKQAKDILERLGGPHPLARSVLLVTFGTPVRYGWDSSGYHYLLHVSHHQPLDADHPTQGRALYPLPRREDLMQAKGGDWVQLGGIVGTDSPTMRDRKVIESYGGLFEEDLAAPDLTSAPPSIVPLKLRHLCARWKLGTRVHADGRNLLVDYEPCGRKWLGRPVEEAVLGHGVATTIDWLPAHLKLVLDWFETDRVTPLLNA